MFKYAAIIFLLYLLQPIHLQAQLKTLEKIEQASKDELHHAFTEFRDFLRIANDGHFIEQINGNMNWAIAAFEKRGFKTQVITTPGAPHVYAEKQFVKKGKTVLFYLQIDGQPVDTSVWDQESHYIA